ncbi:MAG: hypothetical protein FJW39_34330 [Acidobacteria bacterium]|nr:hypothetical protein [Acidobacteriota bacterium]
MQRTQKQIEASRANGARSRGPVTDTGKAASSRNATKHGLTSRDIVLTTEDPADWESLRQSFFDHWQPDGEMESRLVEKLAACDWRLQRTVAMETALLNTEMDFMQPEIDRVFSEIDGPSRQALAFKSLAESKALEQLQRHQTRLTSEFHRTWKLLTQLQQERAAQQQIAAAQNEPEPESAPEPNPLPTPLPHRQTTPPNPQTTPEKEHESQCPPA